jgi:hypothetical protein
MHTEIKISLANASKLKECKYAPELSVQYNTINKSVTMTRMHLQSAMVGGDFF